MYIAATPAATFSTVVTSIEDELYNYALNPGTVVIDAVDVQEQPAEALDIMNLFSNFSNPDSTQTCQ